jgi:hypothetical protein
MPQKTNLNISPYYDDFDKADNFYRVLFKPGFPVQARELTSLQSILQNQLESFGSHIFKEGSMVIPGSVTYDSTYFSIKVNADHIGIDVTVYLDALISNNNGKGTKVRGQNSQIVGTIKNYILPPDEGVDDITLFVKYTESGTTSESVAFPNSEILTLEENVTYGNTTLNAGESILTLVAEDATAIGSAFGVDTGVYFIRGTFVDVTKSLVVLEPYSNKPSYRVGFEILEEIINSNDDPSLNDNAKGFTNYAAPGADRFKISVNLTKKALDDFNDTNFVELFKVRDGEVKKIQNSSVYSEIKKYLAKRTYDESGNYAINPFRVNIQNSLNDEIRTAGLYTENQKTDEGNIPDDDTMCVKLSPGKAYVRGFDVTLPGTTVLDVDKPRDTKTVKTSSVPFRMGSLLKVNNITGTPFLQLGAAPNGDNVIKLYNERRTSGANTPTGNGLEIGQARVYHFGVSDAPYTGATTEWDLYLWDVQTYTTLELSNMGRKEELESVIPISTYVKGASSGATGYITGHRNASEIDLIQTTGRFVQGEKVIFNEQDTVTTVGISTAYSGASIVNVITHSVNDIKSVHQISDTISNNKVPTKFGADAVLYDRILPNFSLTDTLTIEGVDGTTTKATCAGRRFSGKVGISTNSIVGFSTGSSPTTSNPDQTYSRVSAISADGATLTLKTVVNVPGVNGGVDGSGNHMLPVGVTTSSTFRVKVPKIINLNRSGLYARLPRKNVSTVDLSNSNLLITKQISGVNVKTNGSGVLDINTSDALDSNSGISSIFFEPFDAEKYTVQYANGTIETLTSDQVIVRNDGNDLRIIGLNDGNSQVLMTVTATMKKVGLNSKSKDFIRSEKVEVTRTSGISTNGGLVTTQQNAQSRYYGLRVEDKEISLNVPDVVQIHAIYESKDTNTPSLDKLTFVSGLGLDTNTNVGEKIVGKSSRAIGQIVNRVSATEIEFVYLNANTFSAGETVTFKETNISTNIQKVTLGNYVDRTNNYTLDKGHKKQYSDYSRIIRKDNSSIPSHKLLIIFDKYQIHSGNSGDLFTANSYTKDRYTYDIPKVGIDRATDILDFRPRVKPFNPSSTTDKSPFAYNARVFETDTSYVVAPDESSIVGYTYYLPRIDKLVINKFEQVKLIKGVSADKPAPPTEFGDAMEVAQITLPPYLYDPITGPTIRLYDNRRFTMRDIGKLEKRIDNLEIMTSLTALELDTKSLMVTDANGINRFKTGFIVNDFKDRDFLTSGSRCDVDVVNKELISAVDFWSLPAQLAFDIGIDTESADLSANLNLLDPNCKKTGDLITLDYNEVGWIDQPQATQVENINPFNVIVFVGGILLEPASDNWARTIYIDKNRIESTGATWAEQANIVSDNTTVGTDVSVTSAEVDTDQDEFDGNHIDTTTTTTTTTTNVVETSFTNTLEGPSKEFDYVESVKVSGQADPFMRSRNVSFSANGLKPLTKHYHYLDSGRPDIFPKLTEISMISGTFVVNENVRILNNGVQIGYVRVKAPNHKFGDASISAIPTGMGTVSVSVEAYSVDPYDRTRPAPDSSYSATSKLFNCDVDALANDTTYFGYVVAGATLVGDSGATATVSRVELISDNWGDVLGAFFFRNANQTPQPPVLFFSGTKTFKITSTPPGTVTLPGSTAFASDATGTYSGTGTIITQSTSTVGVRNPPPPAQKPNETTTSISINQTSSTTRVEAPYRDPLAQTFTVDETGAFLTSFDVYFASKDPNAKVFVELREVELGTPTSFLVQDFTQVALNPNNIQTSTDASIATNIKFPSPVYLEAGKEYALVFLSPGSDLYEMWVATMGQKTVKTSNLPDVESVVVTKQYIGGSLFKSQNGTIWTPSQYQDLAFKLYKAEFVDSGTVTFYNTPIKSGNENTQVLSSNPIKTLPRKVSLELDWPSASYNNEAVGQHEDQIPIGRKISTGNVADKDDDSITGIIEKIGAPIWSDYGTAFNHYASKGNPVTLVNGGSGYDLGSLSSVPLKSLTGGGSGATVSVTLTNEKVTAVDIVGGLEGKGYSVGDVLTIDDTWANYKRGTGAKFAVGITSTKPDSLYLTDVQGEKFVGGEKIIHYGTSNDTRTAMNAVDIKVKSGTNSVVTSDLYTGNVLEIVQSNHAHHGINNTINITGIKPDTTVTQTTQSITPESTQVSVASTSIFARFAGVSTSTGEALIGSEIVSYTVNIGNLSLNSRGLEGSPVSSHLEGSDIQPYEINGFPLVGINTSLSISTNDTLNNASNVDNYYLQIDRGTSSRISGNTMLCFTDERVVGGNSVGISQNHQFTSMSPKFNVITPGKGTRVSTSVRTISGTSAGGNEVSFLDQGFEPTILNETTFFPTVRMVASKVNEAQRLSTLPRNKSLSLKVDMTTSDKNLSPVLDVQNATFILGRNKVNSPVSDYSTDSTTNALNGDKHGSLFVSRKVNLAQPATSLKVFVAANVQPEADFRVFYRLFSADSSEVSQNYRAFPGYENMIDTDGDGFGDDVIDISKNSGRADAKVKKNGKNDFSEYQFTINDLEQFNGFVIKIVMTSTNEAVPVRLKDFRAIALA